MLLTWTQLAIYPTVILTDAEQYPKVLPFARKIGLLGLQKILTDQSSTISRLLVIFFYAETDKIPFFISIFIT